MGFPPTLRMTTIAVAWSYNPEPRGFARFLTPFTTAGFETWVSPGVNNCRRVYPDNNGLWRTSTEFARDGQKMGSTGQLNTIWNDDGEGLINRTGTASCLARRRHGSQASRRSSIRAELRAGVPRGFIGRAGPGADGVDGCAQGTGRSQAQVGNATNVLFWLDPWSRDGQKTAAQIRPWTHDLRTHAEAALTLIAQARAVAGTRAAVVSDGVPGTASTMYDAAKYGAASSYLREPDAVDAMELGARRMDFIGLKFELADEMAAGYARAIEASSSTDRKTHASVSRELSDLSGINGRMQDLRNGYTLLRDLYESAWLRSNRPYWLRNNLEQYDYAAQIWIARADKIRSAQHQWTEMKTLPSAEDLGIPPAPAVSVIPAITPTAATGAGQ